MSHSQSRRAFRKNVAGNHCGRLLTLEQLESRCCMDASSYVVLRDTSESIPNELNSGPQETESSKIVEFRMQLLDQQRNSVQSVHVGDQVFLQVYVRDLRESIESNFRFFSAYTKVSLEGNQFEVLGQGKAGRDFWQDKNQLEQEIGGWVVSPYPNGDGHLLFEVPIRAIADGEATIQTEPLQGQRATLSPITLYGVDRPLDTTQVSYQSLPVTVLPRLNSTASEINQPNSPAVTPSQTTVVIPQTTDSPSAVLQPQVIQPPLTVDSSVSTVQLPTSVVTDAQQGPELGSSNALDFPSSSLDDLLIVDQENSFVFDSQDTANLDEQLYTDTIDLDPNDFQADGLRLQDLVFAHPFLDLRDASRASSLTSESSLNFVSMPNARTTSHQRLTTLPASRQPSQKIIHSMLQRLGPYTINDSAGFLWEVSYMRIPMFQLKLRSHYVRDHQSIPGIRFEEFVIPRVIVAESVSGKLNTAIPQASSLTLKADSGRANEAWSAYQRASMKPMSLSQENAVDSQVAQSELEVNSRTQEVDAEKDIPLNQQKHSTISWWITGLLSLVASGAWLRDREFASRLLGSVLRKRIPGFSNASRDQRTD